MAQLSSAAPFLKRKGGVHMRKLVRFTLGFALACGLTGWLLWQKNLTGMIVYALVSFLLCWVLQKKIPAFRLPKLVFLGLAMGFLWSGVYRGIYLRPMENLDGQNVHLSATAVGYSESGDYGNSVQAFAVIDGKPYFLHINQNDYEFIEPGTVIEGEFRLRLTTPAGLKDSGYYRGNGNFVIARPRGETTRTQSDAAGIWFLPAKARERALASIDNAFPSDTAPFARALLLGDTSELSYETDTALKTSGIRHVVAVSGLHVSALFGVVYFLLRRKRVLTFFVSVPVLLFFAAVTGFSPSVTRAALMCALMALGNALNEEYDGLTSLSFASLTMMIVNPLVLFSVSFQLSVASVAGILLLASPLSGRIVAAFPNAGAKSFRGKVLRWFASSVSVSVGAMILSTPLSAFYFGSISLIGIVANLLLIGLVSALFCGIGVVGVFGGLLPKVCALLARVLSFGIRLVLLVAGMLAKIPFAAVYTQSGFIVAWLILSYLLLLLYLLRGKGFRWISCVGAVSLAIALIASVLFPRLDTIRLHVLDVGEGQAILLQSDHRNYLIDCGGEDDGAVADEIAQTLLSQGIFHLDGLMLTHYDADHTNALDDLVNRVDIDRFYLPRQNENDITQWVETNYPDRITWVASDTEIDLSTGTITLLAPQSAELDNENSMCILFESPNCVILITGDRGRAGEKELLYNYDLPDVDILIAGHHGSRYSTSQELLRSIRPETVIISVGANNSYGHPSQEVLERLADFGCTVYRTDLMGSVLIRR